MWKKLAMGFAALALLLLSNMELCCRLTVNGRTLDGLYSLSAAGQSETVAALAAEEILSGPAVTPQVERAYRLSFSPPRGDSRALTDLMLRSVTGVKLAQGVFVNGVLLGTVEDGDRLITEMSAFIANQMPNAAVSGRISGELRVKPIYSRSNRDTDYADMLLLISGMAPVIYVDETGKLV